MKHFTPHINPNRACNAAANGGILPLFGAFTGCRRGNLLHIGERIAAPLNRGVFLFGLSFARCAFDGGNVQAALAGCFLYGSFQLARRRLPRGKGERFSKTYRNRIMSALSKAQCIRAQRVQTTLNHLRATARAVRSAVNPYASLDRVPVLAATYGRNDKGVHHA